MNYIPQPVRLNHLRETFKERLALQFNLFSESVMRYKVDIGKPVLSRYSHIAAIGHEVNAFRDAKFYTELSNNVNKNGRSQLYLLSPQ